MEEEIVNTENVEKYAKLVKSASLLSVFVAATLIFLKLFVLIVTGSSTILASFTDSVTDLFASLINFFAILLALKPADLDHRYGHYKIEALASLSQCAFILGSSLFLVFFGIFSIIEDRKLESLDVGIIMIVISTILTIIVCVFQTYVIKKTNSSVISADRLHYLSDILFNIIVLISLVFSFYHVPYIDGIFAILLGIYIAYSALGIGKSAINQLLDKELDEVYVKEIEKIINETDGVIDVHDLRTRSSGPKFFIQAHLNVDKNLTLEKAHKIADIVEERILKRFSNSDVTLHVEPADKGNM